jgi:hypothetical protein
MHGINTSTNPSDPLDHGHTTFVEVSLLQEISLNMMYLPREIIFG